MKPRVKLFTKGKVENKNEDYFGYNDNNFILADGSTDKSGRLYAGKTGGEIASRLIVRESLSSQLNGHDLVNLLNDKIKIHYEQLNIIDQIHDAKYRFTCVFICVRLVQDKIIITYLGDLGFRINGKKVYREVKQVDIDNANLRSIYIHLTNDVPGGRDHIMPFLIKQFDYQNNPKHKLGYGCLDGTETPAKFVKVFEYDADQIQTIELFTDGYYDIPNEISIEAWEKLYEKVEKEDPDKWKKYKSTKSSDDRTIAIIDF